MRLPHFIQTRRTTDRDSTGAIVLKSQKRLDFGAIVSGVCQTVVQVASDVHGAIEQRMDEVWNWISEQDRVIQSWISDRLYQLANAHLQYET